MSYSTKLAGGVFLALVPIAQAQTEIEPNDSANSATILPAGIQAAGELSGPSDVDFWTFDLATPADVTLATSTRIANEEHALTDTWLVLFRWTGDAWAFHDSRDSNHLDFDWDGSAMARLRTPLDAGTYAVSVAVTPGLDPQYFQQGAYAIELVTRPLTWGLPQLHAESEPNDSWAFGQLMPGPFEVLGSIGSVGDRDIYVLSLSEAQNVRFCAEPYGPSGTDVRVVVFDALHNYVGEAFFYESQDASRAGAESVLELQPGVYFFDVASRPTPIVPFGDPGSLDPGNGVGAYRFRVSTFPGTTIVGSYCTGLTAQGEGSEPNGPTSGMTTPLPLCASADGSIAEADGDAEDAYSISLTEPHRLHAVLLDRSESVTDPLVAGQLRLLDSRGVPVPVRYPVLFGGPSPEPRGFSVYELGPEVVDKIEADVDAGTYTLVVTTHTWSPRDAGQYRVELRGVEISGPSTTADVAQVGESCWDGLYLSADSNERPTSGSTFVGRVTGLPPEATGALVNLDFAASVPGVLIPGTDGCRLIAQPAFSLPLLAATDGSGTFVFETFLADPATLNLEFFVQASVVLPGANELGVVTTNALYLRVGH